MCEVQSRWGQNSGRFFGGKVVVYYCLTEAI